jgi:hypothetical protein
MTEHDQTMVRRGEMAASGRSGQRLVALVAATRVLEAVA